MLVNAVVGRFRQRAAQRNQLRVCRKQSTQIVRRDDAGPKRQVRGTREHQQRGQKAGPVSPGEQAKHANGQTRPSQEERRASPWSEFGVQHADEVEKRHDEQRPFHAYVISVAATVRSRAGFSSVN